MRVGFAPGEETLRIPFGTPRPIRFRDEELDLDLTVRARGFATVARTGKDEEELRRQTRADAVATLTALLESGPWTWSDLTDRREAVDEAMEEALSAEGRKMGIRLEDVVPDEATELALKEKMKAKWDGVPLPPAPVDNPMMDGPGAYPPVGSGGFVLYRVGETPPAPGPRSCPRCGSLEPPEANFCTQCGAKL